MKLSPTLSNVSSCLKSVWSIFKDRSNKLTSHNRRTNNGICLYQSYYFQKVVKRMTHSQVTRVTYQILSNLVTRVQHCPESKMIPAHVHRRTTTYTCNTKLHIYMYICVLASVHVMIVTEEYHSLVRNRFSILESNTRKIKVRLLEFL